jgi:hypothetical protein
MPKSKIPSRTPERVPSQLRIASGSMGGISWMWLPTLLVVVLGVVLLSVIFGKK